VRPLKRLKSVTFMVSLWWTACTCIAAAKRASCQLAESQSDPGPATRKKEKGKLCEPQLALRR